MHAKSNSHANANAEGEGVHEVGGGVGDARVEEYGVHGPLWRAEDERESVDELRVGSTPLERHLASHAVRDDGDVLRLREASSVDVEHDRLHVVREGRDGDGGQVARVLRTAVSAIVPREHRVVLAQGRGEAVPLETVVAQTVDGDEKGHLGPSGERHGSNELPRDPRAVRRLGASAERLVLRLGPRVAGPRILFLFFEGVLGLLRFRFLGLVLSGLAGAPGCEGLDAARFGIGHGAGRASEGEAPDAAFVTPRPLVLGRTIATVGVAPRWRSLGNSS